jgi:ribonuclease P protein component
MTATAKLITLTKRADFVRLNRARKCMTDYFILRYGAASDATAVEVGYTVTTKCGNAVMRNRIKRRLRALVRELAPELAQVGVAYNFIARADASPGAGEVVHELLRAAVVKAFGASRQK